MEPVQRRHSDAGTATLVTKLHLPGTDPQALRERLRVAVRCPELLSPLSTEPEAVGERWLTRWPRIEMVAHDPVGLPWAQAGTLLARLHREPLGGFTVVHGAHARLTRALERLDRGAVAGVIRAAAGRLVFPPGPISLAHGDFHLGQLGRESGRYVLIDIDDLGVGDARWDLARPAGFWAAGMVPDADWLAFLRGYRRAGGPALPDGDPWPVLDPFARAAVITAAANHPEDDLLVAACARMA